MEDNARAYGRGEFFIGKPEQDWKKAPWKEDAFDMGVEFAKLWEAKGEMPDLRLFLCNHKKLAGLRHDRLDYQSSTATHSGPNTDMRRHPLTDGFGNVRKSK